MLSADNWTQIRPDKMSGLIRILTVWHSDGIHERNFWKCYFWKNHQMQKADNWAWSASKLFYTCTFCIHAIKYQKIWPVWKLIFKSHRIFIPSKITFYKEIIINHTLFCLLQTSYIKIKAFWLWGRVAKWFCENFIEFCQTSFRFFVNLTDFSPQVMECMLFLDFSLNGKKGEN